MSTETERLPLINNKFHIQNPPQNSQNPPQKLLPTPPLFPQINPSGRSPKTNLLSGKGGKPRRNPRNLRKTRKQRRRKSRKN